jgi:uncharacterized protein
MTHVALFLIVLFAVTWTLGFLWQPPAAPESLWAFLAPLLPSVWAPTVIALTLTWWTGGAVRVATEVRARLRCRPSAAWWFGLAVLVPCVGQLLAVFTARAAGDANPFISSKAVLTMVGVQVITGAVGEELGWRGFLLPRLTARLGENLATWVMAALWSVWHIPAWFNPSLPHHTMPLASTLGFILFFGVFLGVVFNRAGQSALATIVAHLSLNITTGVGGVQLSSVVFWRTLAGVFGVLAIVLSMTGGTRARDPMDATGA